jgi:deoxyuridine 5'-triphosphate nucleotidohydrolase
MQTSCSKCTLDMVLRIQVIDQLDDSLVQLYTNHSSAKKGDAGIDLFVPKDTIIPPRTSILIPLGIKCALGTVNDERVFSYDIRSRSSIYKTPLIQQNGVGTADRDYSGELCMAVYNLSEKEYHVSKHTRLCQIVGPGLAPLSVKCIDKFSSSTERGECGFGSTGI